jgi:hypothetical protein
MLKLKRKIGLKMTKATRKGVDRFSFEGSGIFL